MCEKKKILRKGHQSDQNQEGSFRGSTNFRRRCRYSCGREKNNFIKLNGDENFQQISYCICKKNGQL